MTSSLQIAVRVVSQILSFLATESEPSFLGGYIRERSLPGTARHFPVSACDLRGFI